MEKTDKVLINCGVPQGFILDHCCPYSMKWYNGAGCKLWLSTLWWCHGSYFSTKGQ